MLYFISISSNFPSNLVKYDFTVMDWKTLKRGFASCIRFTVLVNGGAGIGTQGSQTAEHTLLTAKCYSLPLRVVSLHLVHMLSYLCMYVISPTSL